MKKIMIVTLSFTAGALLGLIIMFGLFMDEHEEITTEGIQVETEYYPNGTDRKINIYGSYEDCREYFNRLGVENWVSSGGENNHWVCYYKRADIKIH